MTYSQLFFGVFPYVALILALIVTGMRYFTKVFSYSSLSSQFLENKKLFWGAPPFHYGILVVLTGHLVGFLIPGGVLAWNGVPWRLYALEVSALAFGILALWGLVVLLFRRITDERVRVVTSPMDVVLLLALLLQVVTGVWTAIGYRWGSSWYAGSLVPYLWSILTLRPDVARIETLPLVIQLHALTGFLIVALLPFTRLVHLLSFPFVYLWRPYQVVVWNRKKD